MKIFILAPGPSASHEIAEKIRATGCPLMVVTSAFDLAPWADYIVSGDRAWWLKNKASMEAPGIKICSQEHPGTKRLTYGSGINSGVLALHAASNYGFKEIYLFGFDMRGTHYFGEYKNGLKNTSSKTRQIHISQYKNWQRSNKRLKVFNCTKNSAITCFAFIDYEF
jgi:hypothetical protein